MLNLSLFLIAALVLFTPNAFSLDDWNLLTNMQRDEQGIPVPRNSRSADQDQVPWPVQPSIWQEGKDDYTVSIPLRVPDDADTQFMTYRYSNGEVRITIPKRKLKSII